MSWLLWIALLINIGVHVSFSVRVFIFSGHMPRNGIAGSYNNSIFMFLRKLNTAFQVAAQLYIPTNNWWAPFSLYHLQHLLLEDFLTMVIMICVRWQVTVALICIFLIITNVEHLFMCFLAICRTWTSLRGHLSAYQHDGEWLCAKLEVSENYWRIFKQGSSMIKVIF